MTRHSEEMLLKSGVISGRRPPRKPEELTREAILEYLKSLAKEYPEERVSTRIVDRDAYINSNTIIRRFGSFSKALIEAGISPIRKYKRDKSRMIAELTQLANALGRMPSKSEIARNTSYNARDFEIEFGGIEPALAPKEKSPAGDTDNLRWRANESSEANANSRRSARRRYGERINYKGLRHAPVNELGVVFLFGIVAENLGYEVESIQSGFPDCEAKRRRRDGGLERVDIEFEFRSSNFNLHKHDVTRCDVIVCWEHDWKECPGSIEVIELRAELRKWGGLED